MVINLNKRFNSTNRVTTNCDRLADSMYIKTVIWVAGLHGVVASLAMRIFSGDRYPGDPPSYIALGCPDTLIISGWLGL